MNTAGSASVNRTAGIGGPAAMTSTLVIADGIHRWMAIV